MYVYNIYIIYMYVYIYGYGVWCIYTIFHTNLLGQLQEKGSMWGRLEFIGVPSLGGLIWTAMIQVEVGPGGLAQKLGP